MVEKATVIIVSFILFCVLFLSGCNHTPKPCPTWVRPIPYELQDLATGSPKIIDGVVRHNMKYQDNCH